MIFISCSEDEAYLTERSLLRFIAVSCSINAILTPDGGRNYSGPSKMWLLPVCEEQLDMIEPRKIAVMSSGWWEEARWEEVLPYKLA